MKEQWLATQVESASLQAYADPTTLKLIISELSIYCLKSWNAISSLCWPQKRTLSRAEIHPAAEDLIEMQDFGAVPC